MTIGLNIGYHSKNIGTSGILTYYPNILEVDDFSELDFRDKETIDILFKWAEYYHVTPSSMVLYLTVGDHKFKIRMINVREYRQAWEDKYKTEWKFDREL
jgi:hypothetical protein